jgi:hypothetical protein
MAITKAKRCFGEWRRSVWNLLERKKYEEFSFSITVEEQTNGIRLRIRNLTIEDQGVWECFGTDENGQETKKSFQITIKGLVDWEKLMKSKRFF